MKNKEPKKKWTGKKQIWYGAAGLFCLVAAVLVLILGNGIGAQAESRTQRIFSFKGFSMAITSFGA